MDRRRALEGLIRRHFGSFRKSQRKTICDLTWGLLARGRLGLAAIARGMVDGTTVRHRIKRAWRFARNERLCCRKATVALVGWLLRGCASQVVVALDWTYLGDYVLLAAKVALRRRAVPVAWAVMRKDQFDKDHKSRNSVEEQLIEHLAVALSRVRWVLVADRGFARASLIKKLLRWRISFVIRAIGTTWVQSGAFNCILDNVPRRPGRARRYEEVLYHRTKKVPVSLVLTHREPAAEPWYLITNLQGLKEPVLAYRRRMWIEESFRDAKSNLGLDTLWLASPERMERMMILVAVGMLLAVLVGAHYLMRHGERDPQLSTKRRGGTLSIFRLGLELIRAYGLPPGLSKLRFPLALEGA
jgi:hypothetical protein